MTLFLEILGLLACVSITADMLLDRIEQAREKRRRARRGGFLR